MPCRAVDSTGIKVEGEGEWNARKHGGPKRRIWRKVHLGIDEKTLEIRAVEFTSSDIGDAPILPELLGQIPPDQEIGSVTAAGAYDTRKCHDAIHCPAVHVYMHERGQPGRPCRHPAPQERQVLEARQRRRDRPQRSPPRIETPGTKDLAEVKRLPSPKSR
jgi:hypothetical protein